MNWVSPFVVKKTIFSFPYLFGRKLMCLHPVFVNIWECQVVLCTSAAQSVHIWLKSDEVGQGKAAL